MDGSCGAAGLISFGRRSPNPSPAGCGTSTASLRSVLGNTGNFTLEFDSFKAAVGIITGGGIAGNEASGVAAPINDELPTAIGGGMDGA